MISTRKIVRYFVWFCIFLFGCQSTKSISVYYLSDINEFNWHKDSVKYFVIENNDTTMQHSISMLLRFNPELVNHNNIEIALEVQSPTSQVYRDTLRYKLCNNVDDKKNSTFIDRKYTFIKNAVFQEQGKYIFKINHFDNAPISGIDAIGVIID